MRHPFARIVPAIAALAALAALAWPAIAEEYPVKGRTLTIIVPYPAGGSSDATARLLGQKFAEAWGVAVVVDNKPGGDHVIASQALARAPKDGYTMGLSTAGYLLNQAVRPDPRIDALNSFAPIGLIAQVRPLAIAVNSKSPYRTFADLKAAAASGAHISYSSCCPAMYLAGEMLKVHTGMQATHIPYKGSVPSAQAVLAGDVTFIVDGQPILRPLTDSGRLRPLLLLSRERSAFMPDVPNLNDIGMPGDFEPEAWYGLAFPAGVPPAVVARVNEMLNRVLAMEDVRKRMADAYHEVIPSTPEGMAQRMRRTHSSYMRWARQAKVEFGS